MRLKNTDLAVALITIIVGASASSGFSIVIGRDPDELPLPLTEWVIARVLIGPGFLSCYNGGE